VANLIEESVGGEVKNGDCRKDTGYSSGCIIYRGFHVKFLLGYLQSYIMEHSPCYSLLPLINYCAASDKFIKNLSFPHLDDRDRYFS
jgi:hypothetical protein